MKPEYVLEAGKTTSRDVSDLQAVVHEQGHVVLHLCDLEVQKNTIASIQAAN